MSKQGKQQQQQESDILSMDSGKFVSMKREGINKAHIEVWDILISNLNNRVGDCLEEVFERMRSKKSSAVPCLYGKEAFGDDMVVMCWCIYFQKYFPRVGELKEDFNIKKQNGSGFESMCAKGSGLYKARNAEYNRRVAKAETAKKEAMRAYSIAKTQDAKTIAMDSLMTAEEALLKAEEYKKQREEYNRGFSNFEDVLKYLVDMGCTNLRKYGGDVSPSNPEYKLEE